MDPVRTVAALCPLFLLLACGPDRPSDAPPPEPFASTSDVAAFDVRAFERTMKDPDAIVRAAVLQDLLERAAMPVDGVRVRGLALTLATALEDENRWVRDRAAQALARLGPHAEPALPALVKALRDPDGFVRWRAAKALAAIGPGAAPAREELRLMAAAEDETELGRHWSAEALRAIDGK